MFSEILKKLLIAVQFLTRLPVKVRKVEEPDFAGAMMWFPVVGAFVGLVLALVLYDVSWFGLPREVCAALLVLTSVVITGGFHLDGLSDTADGFYAGKSKEEILQVMDDTHIGAMGAIAVVTVLLLKYSMLASLIYATPLATIVRVLVVVHALSRWGMVLTSAMLPPAKPEGLGHRFLAHFRTRHCIVASILAFVIAICVLQLFGFVLFMVTMVLTTASTLYIRQRIGGLTGDTLGAVNEILEVGGLLAVCFMYRV